MRTVALNKAQDFLVGTDNGYSTLALAGGADAVIQGVIMGLEIKRGDLWFDVSYGVDKNALFFNARGSDSQLAPLRGIAYRDFLKRFRSIKVLGGGFRFDRKGQKMTVTLPCIRVDCEQQVRTFEIGTINAC